MSPKSKLPLGGISATKSIAKSLIFYSRGGAQKVRYYYKPAGDPSAAQAAQRLLIKTKVKAWQALSVVDKTSWNDQAKILGDPWSGYTLFMSTWEGIMNFTELADAFDSYAGHGGKIIRIKAAEDGLEPSPAGGIFLDNFDDAFLYWAWKTETPAGSVSEADGKCLVSIGDGIPGNWWGSGLQQAPRLYICSLRGPMEVITKITEITTNVNTEAGMFITNNPLLGGNYGYTFGRNHTGKVLSVQLGVGTLETTLDSIDLPVWLRIRTIAVGTGNTTFFHYSTDGVTYVSLGSVVNLPHNSVGLYAKNWSDEAIDGYFEFFSIKMDQGPG